MKIIDNKKDYYDYLMGIYGIDTKIVYDRRGSSTLDYIIKSKMLGDDFKKRLYSINVKVGNLIYVINKNEDTGEWRMPEKIDVGRRMHHEWVKNPFRMTKEGLKYEFTVKSDWGSDVIASGDESPLMIEMHYNDKDYGVRSITIDNPILSTFPHVMENIPAATIWDEIYNFISAQYDVPIIDTRTEKQRIESAGFDARTSFRKM